MTLGHMIEAYTILYVRCAETSTELCSLTNKEYLDGDDVPIRHRLCYYAEMLEAKGKQLQELGIEVTMHESFKNYADQWREVAEPEILEAVYGSA